MTGNISDYACIGLVHHLLYPDCADHPENHSRTLRTLARRTDIATIDCCLPYEPAAQGELAHALRNCGKRDLTFCTHFFPLRQLSFCDPSPTRQAQNRILVHDMVEQAAAMGASNFVFASGGPSPADASSAHYAAFSDFCRWLCCELKPYGITAQLEPFDMTVDKRYLYGSTTACVSLVESLQPEIDNLAIELDVAHVPLMGETFAEAIHNTASHLRRVHLGNCILRDTSHPGYGDTHPPIGVPEGEIDVPELANILQLLLEIGFLSQQHRGSLVLEMTPWPGKSVETTINESFQRLKGAWNMV